MIIFKNRGSIDVRAINVMGISSKENDNAIGYFGTGLKYAIAVMLREGISFGIKTGGVNYTFETKRETVRVDEFDFCYMNGRELPFTTDLGKNWDLWQAFRELYCNCIDESGEVYRANWADSIELSSAELNEDATIVWVSSPRFDEIFENLGDIVLQTDPITVNNSEVELHPGRSKFLYYKGIRVYELPSPSIYTYNLTGKIELTEDRTAKDFYNCKSTIGRSFAASTNPGIIREIIATEERQAFESDLDFNWDWIKPSDVFCEVVEYLNDKKIDFSHSAFKLVQKHRKLDTKPTIVEPDEHANKMIDKAVAFCNLLNFPVDEYPIKVSEFLGRRVHGQAADETIYISTEALKYGTKYVASTLIEEFLHLKHGFKDESRELQSYLFETIVDMGERHILKDVL